MVAIVVFVHSDSMVNLAVFDEAGGSFGKTSVQLVAPGVPKPEFGFFCEWMPYQVGQAAKVESERGTIAISKAAADALERIIMKIDQKLLEDF